MWIYSFISCGKRISNNPEQIRIRADFGNFFILLNYSFLALVSIYFWFSLRVKNLIIPIGTAVIGMVVVVALFQAKRTYMVYFPFAFPTLSINPPYYIRETTIGIFAAHEFYSLIYFSVLTLLSYLDFTSNFRG